MLSFILIIFAVLGSCAGVKPGTSPATTSPLPKASQSGPQVNTTGDGAKVWRIQVVEKAYPDGVMSSHTKTTFNSQGQVISEEQYNGSMVLEMKRVFNYSKPNQIQVETYNGWNILMGKSIKEFANSQLLRENHYNAKGDLQLVEEYTYNGQGQRLQWQIQPVGSASSYSKYLWESGRLVEIQVYTGADLLIRSFIRTFASNGTIQQDQEIDAQGQVLGQTTYLWEGLLLFKEERRNANGDIQTTIQYRYDQNGNAIELRQFDRRGQLIEIRSQIWKSFESVEGEKP
jgi:antitoxin component YwqK of YwqJK toxin-antitoxin module